MSQETVKALRAVYRAIATGDLSMLFELCDPDVEVTEPPEIPDSSSYHGHDGIRAVFGKRRNQQWDRWAQAQAKSPR